MNQTRRLLAISITAGLIMFCLGYLVSDWVENKSKKRPHGNNAITDTSHYTRNNPGDIGDKELNKFINPLLDCEGNFGEIGPSFVEGLKNKTEELRNTPGITSLSVYFRQLNDGRRIGINEYEQYIPASLLKVPLMIATYRFLELHPEKINVRYPFDDKIPAAYPNRIPGSKGLIKGNLYTLQELINYMIIYSDNNAASILQSAIDPSVLKHVFNDLGLKSVEEVPGIYGISAVGYATFLRILFNATYLNRTHSAQALEIMSKVEYKNALVAGLPPNTTISHKFGERESDVGRQLHDCGIIYRNGAIGDYLLCIMVKGDTYPKMEKIIAEISKYVYDNSSSSVITPHLK